MHLLVLSAFRPKRACSSLKARIVSMHLLVLSAFRRKDWRNKIKVTMSQCTFWCSVLSDLPGWDRSGCAEGGLNAPSGAQCFPTATRPPRDRGVLGGLNAPSGAQCFPTEMSPSYASRLTTSQCTFWCSVLSDRTARCFLTTMLRSQCTFWCSVLSDRNRKEAVMAVKNQRSQCTFWCSVLSDMQSRRRTLRCRTVSMHLLVLSAFRHGI